MAKKVTANGKEFTFDDNATEQQIGEAIDSYFKGQVKKKEQSQGLPSQKVPTPQAQPTQSKSSGTSSFMGGAEDAYQESKNIEATKQADLGVDLQSASKELFNQYKQSPLIPKTIKESLSDENVKSVIDKKLGLQIDINADGSTDNIEKLSNDVIFSLNKKKRDESLKDIGINEIDKVDAQGVLYGGQDYIQSRTGKIAEFTRQLKDGKTLAQEDFNYISIYAPKIVEQLKQEASQTESVNQEFPQQGIINHYATFNFLM